MVKHTQSIECAYHFVWLALKMLKRMRLLVYDIAFNQHRGVFRTLSNLFFPIKLLTAFYRHLDICRAITAESLPHS